MKFPWQQRQIEGQDHKDSAINFANWGINMSLALSPGSNAERTL